MKNRHPINLTTPSIRMITANTTLKESYTPPFADANDEFFIDPVHARVV